MTDSARRFLNAVMGDEALHEEINAVDAKAEDVASRVIAIARKHGFELTEGDLERGSSDSELGMDEQDTIVGDDGGACVCVVGGIGKSWGDHDDSCTCVIGVAT